MNQKTVDFSILERKELEDEYKQLQAEADKLYELKREQEKEIQAKIDFLHSQRNAVSDEYYKKVDRLRGLNKEACDYNNAQGAKIKFDAKVEKIKKKFGEFGFQYTENNDVVADMGDGIYLLFGYFDTDVSVCKDGIGKRTYNEYRLGKDEVTIEDRREWISKTVELMKNIETIKTKAMEEYIKKNINHNDKGSIIFKKQNEGAIVFGAVKQEGDKDFYAAVAKFELNYGEVPTYKYVEGKWYRNKKRAIAFVSDVVEGKR